MRERIAAGVPAAEQEFAAENRSILRALFLA